MGSYISLAPKWSLDVGLECEVWGAIMDPGFSFSTSPSSAHGLCPHSHIWAQHRCWRSSRHFGDVLRKKDKIGPSLVTQFSSGTHVTQLKLSTSGCKKDG